MEFSYVTQYKSMSYTQAQNLSHNVVGICDEKNGLVLFSLSFLFIYFLFLDLELEFSITLQLYSHI